jgi:hypothetical protein
MHIPIEIYLQFNDSVDEEINTIASSTIFDYPIVEDLKEYFEFSDEIMEELVIHRKEFLEEGIRLIRFLHFYKESISFEKDILYYEFIFSKGKDPFEFLKEKKKKWLSNKKELSLILEQVYEVSKYVENIENERKEIRKDILQKLKYKSL